MDRTIDKETRRIAKFALSRAEIILTGIWLKGTWRSSNMRQINARPGRGEHLQSTHLGLES